MMQSLVSNTLLLLFSCFLLFPRLTKGQGLLHFHYCSTANYYTSGSVYEENLNITLTSLATYASLTGFNITSVGQNPDVVYGLVQCRGDVSEEDCQTCANTSAVVIRKLCPNKKEASIVYDYCSLHYADSSFFSTVKSSPSWYLNHVQNVADPVLFNHQLGNLLRNLSSNAASNPFKFAVGRTDYTDFINIYAMMECTRDLAEDSCFNCLQYITTWIPICCDRKLSAGIFSISCTIRFGYQSYGNLRYGIIGISSSHPPLAEVGSHPSPSLLGHNSTTAGSTNSTSPDGKKNTSRTIIKNAIPVAVALIVTSVICCGFLWRKRNRERVDGVHECGDKTMGLRLIGFSTLRIATRNFSDECKLGEGSFGPVYKGELFDGREIAVKRFSNSSGQGLEELKTEVMLIAKLQHRNLVRLLGICLEKEEKLLVYEYLPNGSLDKVLFDQSKQFSLNWERRYKIIVGIARGLLYLHEDSPLRIIHRYLKARNILLDEDMNPKISDFGLAKLLGDGQNQVSTSRIAGTFGYMAPEYAMSGHFSTKSDAYSFGVLVLEILTGRKNSSFHDSMNLQSYAWQHWADGKALEVMDPILGDQWPRDEVSKCIHIGLLCVQEAVADRPTMSEIVLMLIGHNSITSPVPSRPAFFVSGEDFESDVVEEVSHASQSDQSNPV